MMIVMGSRVKNKESIAVVMESPLLVFKGNFFLRFVDA